MGDDYLKKCQPQIAGEDVLWLVSSDNCTLLYHHLAIKAGYFSQLSWPILYHHIK